MDQIFKAAGFLIAIIACILAVAGLAALGPIPLSSVFVIGCILYRLK